MGPKEQRDLREEMPPHLCQDDSSNIARLAILDESVFKAALAAAARICKGAASPRLLAEELKRRLELAAKE